MHFGFLSSQPQWDLTFKNIEEYTQTVDSRWKIPRYDRPDSLAITESHLNELFLSLSFPEKEGEIYHYIDWQNRDSLFLPKDRQGVFGINCESFPLERIS